MKTVWKFELTVFGRNKILMPKGAKIVSVADQCGAVCFWAVVDTEEVKVKRVFWLMGTGQDMGVFPKPERMEYVGIVQQPPYVWHVWEEIQA